jgi:hypothetical protein
MWSFLISFILFNISVLKHESYSPSGFSVFLAHTVSGTFALYCSTVGLAGYSQIQATSPTVEQYKANVPDTVCAKKTENPDGEYDSCFNTLMLNKMNEIRKDHIV